MEPPGGLDAYRLLAWGGLEFSGLGALLCFSAHHRETLAAQETEQEREVGKEQERKVDREWEGKPDWEACVCDAYAYHQLCYF